MKDETRSGAQAGCAFFKLCIKKPERGREPAFWSTPRRLIGRLSPGYYVKDLNLYWEIDSTGDVQWYGSESDWFGLQVLSEARDRTASCPLSIF